MQTNRRTEISAKIIEDWGTVTHFCRKNDINYNTFDVVMNGMGTSKRITDILIAHGYIKDASQMPEKKSGAKA